MQLDFDPSNPPQMPAPPQKTWAERNPLLMFWLGLATALAILVGVAAGIAWLFSTVGGG